MIFKIYKIVNKVNNKIYIGQTHFDKPSYLGSGILIKAAIEKYGIENFDKEYIDEATNQKDLDLKEIYWIKEYQSQNPDIGYNIADGGWNMCTMNDHIATKISKTLIDPYSAVIKCGVPVKGWLNSAFKNYFGYMMGCTVNAKNRFGGYVGEKEVYFWIRDNGMTEIAPPFKFQPMK